MYRARMTVISPSCRKAENIVIPIKNIDLFPASSPFKRDWFLALPPFRKRRQGDISSPLDLKISIIDASSKMAPPL